MSTPVVQVETRGSVALVTINRPDSANTLNLEVGMDLLAAAMSDEKELLTELSHHESNSRLSCQIEFTNELAGLRVTIAPDE